MAQIGTLVTFTSNTVIASADVNQNFTDVKTVYNAHDTSTTQHGATGAVVGTTNTQTMTNKTLTAVKIGGAGAGVGTLQYANSANNRTVTIPDPGGADTFVMVAYAQTLTSKTLTSPALTTPTLAGAGVGVATLQYANSATSRACTVPDPGADDTFVMLAADQTLTGKTLTSPVVNNSGTDSITAFAGGGQTNGVVLTTYSNRISVCVTAGDSVKLPSTAAVGLERLVINDGATRLDLFPASGDQIEGITANGAIQVLPGQRMKLICTTADANWRVE